MNNIAKVAIALAAVLVVAVVGLNLAPDQGGRDRGRGPDRLADTIAHAHPDGPTDPTPVPSPSMLTGQFPPAGPLTAGTYDATSDGDLVPFSFTVPAGWKSVGWFLTNDPNDPGDAQFNLRLTFVPVGNLYADPCHRTLATPAIGPSVDDLVAGLMTLPGTTGATTTDVMLDGRNAKLVQYTIRKDNVCTGDGFYLWRDVADGDFLTTPPYGGTVRTWIVDVDGSRFVIMADIKPGTTAAQKVGLQEVVDSISFGG